MARDGWSKLRMAKKSGSSPWREVWCDFSTEMSISKGRVPPSEEHQSNESKCQNFGGKMSKQMAMTNINSQRTAANGAVRRARGLSYGAAKAPVDDDEDCCFRSNIGAKSAKNVSLWSIPVSIHSQTLASLQHFVSASNHLIMWKGLLCCLCICKPMSC